MMLKLLLVALAISAVPSQTEGQLLDTIQQWNDTLKRILEVFESIQQISEVDLVEWVNNLATSENLTSLVLYILDNHASSLPDGYVCVLRVVVDSDDETKETIREFINEVVNYVNLVRERDAIEAECETIDTSGLLGTAAYQSCRLRYQQAELAANASYARLSRQLLQLREIWSEGMRCFLQE